MLCERPTIGNYITSISPFPTDDVQDVTWRYANNHKELQSKRSKCNENELLQSIILLRNKRRVKLTPIRCTYLNKRSMIELVELMTPKPVTENERKGRSSGSLDWKLSRGEQNVNNVKKMRKIFRW